jgi:HlyD family secretion protein
MTLLPGMTTNVRIITAKRDDVVKVPNAALRFRPPGAAADGAQKKGEKDEKGEKGGASGGSAQGQALRERLTKELGLTVEQQAKLETIQNETRNRIAGISVDDPAERKKEIGRLRAQSRAQIAEILNEEPRKRYDAMVAEQQGRAITRGRVWVQDASGTPKLVSVRLGVSDGTFTELVGDDLKAGDEVIVGTGATARGESKAAPPRFGF